MTSSVPPPSASEVVAARTERVRQDRAAATAEAVRTEKRDPSPPPAESGRGRRIDRSA
jgi:hypothetical protein